MHNGGFRVASGGGASERPKISSGERTPMECITAASCSLLVGVARKHAKILAFGAADFFVLAPNRMHIGADLRHRVFEGVAKMRRRGL